MGKPKDTARDQGIREYWIPQSCLAEFQKRLDKLNRKGAKLDLAIVPLTVTVTTDTEKRAIGEGPVTFESAPNPTVLYSTFVKVLVSGTVPQIEGWRFLARIEHIRDGQNICHTYPGADTIPERFWKIGPYCDHCNINRYRKDTYIIWNKASNDFKQVGSSCIKDFLGRAINPSFWSVYASLCDPDKALGDGYRSTPEYALTDVLAYTATAIRTEGWVSSGKAYETGEGSTKDRVSAHFWNAIPDNCKLDRPTAEDSESAKKAIAWAKNVDATDNYLQNIKVLAETGIVTDRAFGLACSIIAAYHRAIRQAEKPKAVESISEHIGEIGKRQEFTVTVQGIFTFDGTYGTTAIHRMLDEKGNVLTWFASGNPENDLEKDKTYHIKGTVKKHDVYKGTKQTIINRVKVVD